MDPKKVTEAVEMLELLVNKMRAAESRRYDGSDLPLSRFRELHALAESTLELFKDAL